MGMFIKFHRVSIYQCISLLTLFYACATQAISFPNSWASSPQEKLQYIVSEDEDITIDFIRSAGSSNDWIELKHTNTSGSTTTHSPVNTHVRSFSLEQGLHTFEVEYCQEDLDTNEQDCESNNYILKVLVSSPPSAIISSLVAKMPHQSSVTPLGDAQIVMPIQLLPGVGGFSPSFVLRYNSGRTLARKNLSQTNTTLGYGWALDGISEIRRCVVNKSSNSVVQLTSADNLCLDGMPLHLASGTHLQNGATYRTEIETFTKIVTKISSGKLWFEVHRPDGSMAEYGNTPESRVNYNNGVDFQWSINEATSAEGNVISYDYFKWGQGTNAISKIEYDGAVVLFGYQDRIDALTVSIGNAYQSQEALLNNISVLMNGVMIREYRLINQTVNGMSLLKKVQQCGFNEEGFNRKCLAPSTISWTTNSVMNDVGALVTFIKDSFEAEDTFEYANLTVNGTAGKFTEMPFGNPSLSANTTWQSGSGTIRHVVSGMGLANSFKDDYLMSYYSYQGVGVKSTKHWGFLGFHTQRVKDHLGNYTYIQYRMDFPYFGSIARVKSYSGKYGTSGIKLLSHNQRDYATKSIDVNASSSSTAYYTIYPYIKTNVDFHIFNGTSMGASYTSFLPEVSGLFIEDYNQTTQIASEIDSWSSNSTTWGAIDNFSLDTVEKYINVNQDLVNSSQDWVVGFVGAREVTVRNENAILTNNSDVKTANALFERYGTTARTLSSTLFPYDGALTLAKSYDYDSNGNRTSVSTSGDNIVSRQKTVNNFIEKRYPAEFGKENGSSLYYNQYDLRYGKPKISIGQNGETSYYTYDEIGRLISYETQFGELRTIDYVACSSALNCPYDDDAGVYLAKLVKIETSPSLPTQRTYFDSLGRVIRSAIEGFDGSYIYQDFVYSYKGYLDKKSEPYYITETPLWTRYYYDAQSRVTRIVKTDNGEISYNYGNKTWTTYVKTTTELDNNEGEEQYTTVDWQEYNILGQLVLSINGYGSDDEVKTEHSYDANNRIISTTVTGDDGASSISTFEYDRAGNRIEHTDSNSGTTVTAYSALGEPISITTNDGETTYYTYDGSGRLKQKTSGSFTATWIWDSATNGKGKLASKNTNDGFSESYSYNVSSQLTQISTSIKNFTDTTAQSFTTSLTYDAYGRASTMQYASGFAVSYHYNTHEYLDEIKDGSNNLLKRVNALNAYGQIEDLDFGNGVTTQNNYTSGYDNKNGLLKQSTSYFGNQVISKNTYNWLSDGTLTSKRSYYPGNLSNSKYETYFFDDIMRLDKIITRVNYPATSSAYKTQTYDYDGLGNITEKDSSEGSDKSLTNHVYNGASSGKNALTYVNVNGTGYTLDYNDNGAVESYNISGTNDDKFVAYNADNLPIKIVIGNGINDSSPEVIEEFKYDPDGNIYGKRTRWNESGVTKEELTSYIGNVQFTRYQNDYYSSSYKTSVSKEIMHVEATRIGHSSPTYESTEYALLGVDGSIELVTDQSGNIIDEQAFEAFGARKSLDWKKAILTTELSDLLINNSTHVRKIRGFTGHMHLDRTGFIHMRGRLYDPVLGRFLSPDPIVGSTTNSQRWNRYSYVLNNPMKYTDPSGFDAETKCEQRLGEGNCTEVEQDEDETADNYQTREIWWVEQDNWGYGGYACDSICQAKSSAVRTGYVYVNTLSHGIVDNDSGGLSSSSSGAQKSLQQRANEIAAEVTKRGYFLNKGEADLLYELNFDPNLKVILNAKYLTVDMKEPFTLDRKGKLSARASVRGFPFGQGGIHGNVVVVDRQDGTYGIYDTRYDYDMKNWLNPMNWARNLNTLMGPTSCLHCGTGYKTDFIGNVNVGSTK